MVVVTLDDEHIDIIEQVISEFRAVGMDVRDSLEMLGQVTGEINVNREDRLRKIPGVMSVDKGSGISTTAA